MKRKFVWAIKNKNILKQKNAKLKQQLQNAIVPKYHIGQVVYEVINKSAILPFEITEIFSIVFNNGKRNIKYFSYKRGAVVSEDFLFATEVEAQKFLSC